MTRVTFRDTPSPFLSIATLQKPTATKEVSDNVSKVLTGARKNESAVNLRVELCNRLSEKGFQLTKWASNSRTIMETTPLRNRELTLVPTTEPENM